MPSRKPARARTIRTVAVVTGSRAEFGLLRSVMDAVRAHPALRLRVVAAGSHMLPPARTIREVEAAYTVAARVPMQRAAHSTRAEDARGVARGIYCFTRVFAKLKPDWVVVLGDRIEAFAAASAASISGLAVCHIHGGDRAEGIADEAMRHAITKLAHLHCAATSGSATRLVRMGERPAHVHVCGSPAIDGLAGVPAMSVDAWADLGLPVGVFLMHPAGGTEAREHAAAARALRAWARAVPGRSTLLVLEPNHDAGRAGIVRALGSFARHSACAGRVAHLPRAGFVGLLKRLLLASPRAVLLGNSSAGLIECAALGVPAVNLGPRQAGRERAGNVIDVPRSDEAGIVRALGRVLRLRHTLQPSGLFGTGRAGQRIAALLDRVNPHDSVLLRKRNAY